MNPAPDCPLCRSRSSMQSRRYASRSGFHYRIAKCNECGFQFKVTEDDLNDIYKHVYDTGNM